GMGYHYRARCEFILFFEKGHRNLHDRSVADVLDEQVLEKIAPAIIVHPRVQGYPTEKPVGVSALLVKQSSDPGELVLDPFFGSASTGVAAIKHERNFIGTDISDAALELGRSNLLEAGGVEAQVTPWELMSREVTG